VSASVGEEKVEPNLTALLDLILQIVMFFMVCVNFVSEQINASVQLPESTSAAEIQAKTDSDVLVINIEVLRQDRKDPSGKVIRDIHGHPVRDFRLFGDGRKITRVSFANRKDIEFPRVEMDARGVRRTVEEAEALLEAQRFLSAEAKAQRARQSRETGRPVSAIKEVNLPIVIRADVETSFGLVYPLIATCNKEGFPKVELRAVFRGGR
jgi:biopolymer transport protein ExbD